MISIPHVKERWTSHREVDIEYVVLITSMEGYPNTSHTHTLYSLLWCNSIDKSISEPNIYFDVVDSRVDANLGKHMYGSLYGR